MTACTWTVSIEDDSVYLELEHVYALLNIRPVSEGSFVRTDAMQLTLLQHSLHLSLPWTRFLYQKQKNRILLQAGVISCQSYPPPAVYSDSTIACAHHNPNSKSH